MHALRLLPITADEYWRMTVVEMIGMLEGAATREENAWNRTAWLAANLINVSMKSVKKNVTPSQLLGRDKGKPRPMPPKPSNPEADFKELMRRQEALNARKAN